MNRVGNRVTILGEDTDDEDITYDLTGRFGQSVNQMLEEQAAQQAAVHGPTPPPSDSSQMDFEEASDDDNGHDMGYGPSDDAGQPEQPFD